MSCYELQVKVISIIEMVLSCLLLILFGFFAIVVATKRDVLNDVIDKYPDQYPHLSHILKAATPELIALYMFPFIYFTVELGLGILLFRSADKRQYKRLRLWFTVTVTLTVVGILFFSAEILRNQNFSDVITMYVINLAFTVYSLWAVHCLMQEIKVEGLHHPVPYTNGFYKL